MIWLLVLLLVVSYYSVCARELHRVREYARSAEYVRSAEYDRQAEHGGGAK